ncbi:MAG: TspO/MBR family protein [Alphaproteobacteria bacterium]|nr:TspO/MBR family protein [Alphaproteobacteria bacterium]
MPFDPQPLSKARDILGLLACVGLCLGVSAIGGAVTASSVDTWYQTLAKPVFNPPDWVFAPVWTALYLLMAVAAWRIWRGGETPGRRRALGAFFAQLALNLTWSILFFGARRIDLALIEIAVLLAAIIVTAALFRRIDRFAGSLLAPYALWVAYAAALNFELWRLN